MRRLFSIVATFCSAACFISYALASEPPKLISGYSPPSEIVATVLVTLDAEHHIIGDSLLAGYSMLSDSLGRELLTAVKNGEFVYWHSPENRMPPLCVIYKLENAQEPVAPADATFPEAIVLPVEMTIGTNGRVVDASFTGCSPVSDAFAREFFEHVKAWVWYPAMRPNHTPVQDIVHRQFVYRLNRKEYLGKYSPY